MPIRTHRGRAAVYRRLWGWPLRSPRHLVTALVVLGVLVVLIGFLLPEPPPNRYQGADRPIAQSERPLPPSTRRPAPPTFSVPQAAPPPTAPDPAGLAVVDAWGRAWVNHPPGTSKQQWLDGLRQYTTDEFLPVMESVEPANVPSTAVTGPPVAVESRRTSMDVRLPTNAGDLNVTVIKTPAGWRVSQYSKVD
ncbi:hypothetical protein HUO13_10365 [Saccharopolyspora erythraea]|uniref:hypothetical protein n=1 Tax=Saccharopolyspora erythraea TaxID=1836 RepID=UPI001BABE185|nr:hypothetical protein [Saccharopolyspora erythraea]QUH01160.1 hypothetical protein HUO13_10365 [Saccharopolyspora erythraea]